MSKIDVAGLKIDSITKEELLARVLARILENEKTSITTVYSEFLYAGLREPKIMGMLNKADIAVPDGIGVFWASRYLSIPLTAKTYWGKILQAAWQIKYSLAAIIFYSRLITSALPEKIVGADLIWDLAKLAADNNLSVYLLGGRGQTPELASNKITTIINNGRNLSLSLKIAGWSNKNPHDESVIEDINRSNADILLVAYGPIKQEMWIAENLSNLNVKVAMGVGGSFDYIAGVKTAPPKFIRYGGLEWLWRLITQPYRIKRIINATWGLINGLWHYKVFQALPLRPNVVPVILNGENKLLICLRNPKNFYIDIIGGKQSLMRENYWQLPQGGINPEEDIVDAAKREAAEETGLKNLQLIKISPSTNTYIWNNAVRTFWQNKGHRNQGQRQKVVYLKFLGSDSEIKVDGREFVGWQWIDIRELERVSHPERVNLVKIVAQDLKDLA